MYRWLTLLALVGYHAVRWRADRERAVAIAANRPVGRPSLERWPRVTVLVAAWNERDRIETHVRSVQALSYPDLELILCAGGSDGTLEAARSVADGKTTVIEQAAGEGKQAALRRAIAHASGEIVYLTDADCVLDNESFERTIQPIVDGAGASTGRSRPIQAQICSTPSVLCQWAPPYVAESAQGDTSGGLLGRNCAVRRDVLRRTGDFAADVPTGTDYHLAQAIGRLGVPIAFARWSFVETAMPASLGAYVRQQSRWLRNHWIHAGSAVGTADRRHVLRTWGTGLAVIGMPLLLPLLGGWATTVWLALLLHGSCARVRYVAFLGRAESLPRTRPALAVAPLWFVVDAWAWVRSLVDVLSRSGRRRW